MHRADVWPRDGCPLGPPQREGEHHGLRCRARLGRHLEAVVLELPVPLWLLPGLTWLRRPAAQLDDQPDLEVKQDADSAAEDQHVGEQLDERAIDFHVVAVLWKRVHGLADAPRAPLRSQPLHILFSDKAETSPRLELGRHRDVPSAEQVVRSHFAGEHLCHLHYKCFSRKF